MLVIQTDSWFVVVGSSVERVATAQDEIEAQGQLEDDFLMFHLCLKFRYRTGQVID